MMISKLLIQLLENTAEIAMANERSLNSQNCRNSNWNSDKLCLWEDFTAEV